MIRAVAGALLGLLLVHATSVAAKEIGPDGDWCGAIQALALGEDLVLRLGDYPGPCSIRRGGTSAAPLVIRAKDPQHPPRITYLGRSDNVLNIWADHVAIRGLQFGPTFLGVDAIRIHTGDDITIEDCQFFEIGGIAVVANHASVQTLAVRRNEIAQSKSTAMYFGCHDGERCRASELLIERNFIHGVWAQAGEIGYGVQVKLNSTAIIRDNIIVDTKGPAIMVYGATDPIRASVVERNFVSGSLTSSGIVVGGGPAIVRNNVAIASAESGIGLEDYDRRGLLRRLVVVHNTVYGNVKGGILIPAEGRLEAHIANNAVQARPGTPAFPRTRVGVLSMGNVDCTDIPCFVNPAERDFSPLALGASSILGADEMPRDDYFGLRRGVPSTVGAIEQPAGPIPLGMKVVP